MFVRSIKITRENALINNVGKYLAYLMKLNGYVTW